MKQIKLLVFGLILSSFAMGQTVKIQTGTTLSTLDWEVGNLDLPIYNETLIGYSVFTGIDYLENTFFNLSSNVGFIRKGGKGTMPVMNDEGEPIGENTQKAVLDYFTINTTLDIKYPIKDKIMPFITVGPRFDYLMHYSNEFDVLEEIGALKSNNIGLILGGGIKYDFSKIQLGFRTDYYLNFTKVADWPVKPDNYGGKVNDKTISLNVTIGYKL